jgi:hypothetical protein
LREKSAAADPVLPREATLYSKQEAWTTGGSTLVEGKGFAGVYFFLRRLPLIFLFFQLYLLLWDVT